MSDPSSRPENEPVSRAAWSLLLFLTLLNILNFVDRVLISALAPLLIADLGLSKTDIGLLAGFGFVLLYTVVGIFLGLAADRWPRLPLVAGGVALWSLMTGISGLARSFVQLAIPRIFVGIGEATLTPAALSMLGDAFPRHRLGLATGVYYTGLPLGTATSLILASLIAPRYGWRMCFFVLGVFGLVAVAGLRLFREPARRRIGASLGGAGVVAERPRLGDLARDVGRAIGRRRELALVLLGGSLLCYGAGSAIHVITWLVHERGFPFQRAALTAGVIAVAAGLVGNLAGGVFGDWGARRWRHGRLKCLALMTAFFTPIGLVFYSLAPGTALFYACWFIASAGTSAWFGPLYATIQELSPQHTRSTMVAFALLVVNLLGVGPGSLVTGMIGDARSLSLGLTVSLCVVSTASVVFWLAARIARPECAATSPAAG